MKINKNKKNLTTQWIVRNSNNPDDVPVKRELVTFFSLLVGNGLVKRDHRVAVKPMFSATMAGVVLELAANNYSPLPPPTLLVSLGIVLTSQRCDLSLTYVVLMR